MSNLVIVAVPAKDDPVWKVSTEKVPHLTLLFLGEMTDDDGDLGEDVNRIVEFVEHAIEVSEHGPFMMDVDYRDTLGPDDADVLFFKKNGWSSKWITQLRSQLLQQSDIKTAYDSNEQYPEWTPHLTLGYPTAPAKDDAVDYPISWITFDRIAVWTGDYEGEEFRLQWPERDSSMDVAWSSITERGKQFVMSHTSVLDDPTVRQRVQDKLKDIMEDVTGDTDGDVALFGDPIIRTKLQSVLQDLYGMGLSDAAAQAALDEGLAHYGVKGMRWGVRKEEVTSGAKRAASSTGKALVKGAKAVGRGVDNASFALVANHPTVHTQIVQHASEKLVKSLPYYKKKHPVGGQFKHRMKKPFSPEARAYRKDIKKAYIGHLETSANAITNGQGNRRYTLKENGKPNTSKYHWTVKSEPVPVKHDAVVDSDTDAVSVNVQPIYDADGYFVDVKVLGSGKPVDAPEDEEGDDAEHSLKMRVGEQFILEHYGIKGMRWGQRKEEPTAVTPHASSRVPQGAKRKTKIDTQGGENHPAHEDAIKVARAQAKLKKSGAAALSNQELRDVANRVQLEKQVALLTGHKGRQFVARNLRSEGENLARAGVRTGVKTGVKRAGLAALTL